MSAATQDSNLIELLLSCSSWQQAQRIADSLLSKQLIRSAQFLETSAQSPGLTEIKLIMHSLKERISEIEAEIAELSGLDKLVLQEVPVAEFPDELVAELK